MLSIVIIVKNDRAVEKTLSSLKTVKKPCPIEVIVIDGSNGKLDEVKKRFSDAVWVNYKVPTAKMVTIPQQRNVGLSRAKGEAVVFIDASCIPVKDWLSILFNRFKRGEEIVSGPVVPSNSEVVNNISARLSYGSNYIDECPTANVLISKKVINAVGQFDENFEYGSDTDYMWRARALGFKIYFENKAIVSHDWGSYKQQLKRSYNYGKGRMRLYIKHKLSISHMLSKDPILFFYPIYLLLSPIALIFPLYLGLLIIPILKNLNEKPFHVLLQNTIYGFGGLMMLASLVLSRKHNKDTIAKN